MRMDRAQNQRSLGLAATLRSFATSVVVICEPSKEAQIQMQSKQRHSFSCFINSRVAGESSEVIRI